MQNNYELLISEFQGGNPAAFKKIYDEFYPGLYYFAWRLVGKSDEADDVVAEVFIKLWDRRADFETYGNIKAFLYISVRNASMSALRLDGNRSDIRKKLGGLLTDREEPLYRAEMIQEQLIRAEVLEAFYLEVKEFPPQMREIFEMRRKNMAYAAIASELNTSEDSVRHQVAAGIRRLRKKPALRRRWMLLRMLMRY